MKNAIIITKEKRTGFPLKKLVRFILFIYLLPFLSITLGLVLTHLKIYRIDWTKYDNNGNYYHWVEDKVKPLGIIRIIGNEQQIQNIGLALPFILGVLLSLTLFILFWKSYTARTFMPLVALIGYLFPLIPMSGVNLLAKMVIGLFLILFGSITTIFSAKNFSKPIF